MTILQALSRAYDRLSTETDKDGNPLVSPFGFSQEKISFCISLDEDGTMVGAPHDLRVQEKSKKLPRQMVLPQPTKRTVGIASNYLWDKSSYALGITATPSKRTLDEHRAFVNYHKTQFKDIEDEGLKALVRFQENWKPEDFEEIDWPDNIKKDILDANICFALESERKKDVYLHNRSAAKEIWANLSIANAKEAQVCLISGKKAPLQRLHPSIKGVWGGQSAGASIVSFNLDSFTSYGHEQGANAPVSEAAAFAYTTVLNKFLSKGSHNRIQIGDASTVFWADADDKEIVQTAERLFASLIDNPEEKAEKNIALQGADLLGDVENKIDFASEEKQDIRPILEKIHNGELVSNFMPRLSEGVKFYVLGLSPNAARISIRFWYEGTFGQLAENYQRFQQEMAIEPKPHGAFALWKYLCETAVLGKRENVSPNLAGNWMQSILLGSRYPQTIFNSILTRIHADHGINARRVSILKSLLIRNYNSKEASVAFDPTNTNKGYLLGRLFAIYERIQESAVPNANATIKDKFYASASRQPRKIFTYLDNGSANHLSKIRKENKGREVYYGKLIAEIMAIMSPIDDPFPIALSDKEQGLFTLGYYHQRNEFFKTKEDKSLEEQA